MIIIPSNVGAAAPAATLVTSGLRLNLDAGNTSSYVGSGTTWADVSGIGNHFNLSSSSSYTTFNGVPVMNFDSATGPAVVASSPVTAGSDITVQAFTAIDPVAGYRTLLRANVTYHQILLWDNGIFGVYNGAWYPSSTNVSSISNFSSQLNCLTWKLGSSAPFSQLSVNGSSSWVASVSTAGAAFYNSISLIGGIGTGSNAQGWGKIAAILIYNRHLTDAEIAQNYSAYKTRFSLP